MKPKLSIQRGADSNNNWWRTLGKTELLSFLRDSGLFEVTYHNDSIHPLRGQHATILYYNDKKIYFDLWEYNTPTYTDSVMNSNFDLIIKLQHKIMTDDQFENNCRRKGILQNFTKDERLSFRKKIVPWTFFCSRMIFPYIGKEEELQGHETDMLGFFYGKKWRGRKGMFAHLEKEGIDVHATDQGERKAFKISDEEYLDKMLRSKYGIVLKGRGCHLTEAKNRREIDYMMMKKPLLMNYKPLYYNPLIEGKHYIYLDERTDINNLEDKYDLDQIVENAYDWYIENASKEGAANTFKKIVEENID